MKTSFTLSIALFAVARFACGQTQPSPEGVVHFDRYSEPALDPYVVAPDPTAQAWIRDHFFRMDVFSPFFDSRTQWFPRADVYLNLYGVDPADPLVVQHPEWLMHGVTGDLLWIPFACDTKVCAHYAGDFSNPNFRAWWITNTRSIMSRGYIGMLLDDVDMDLNATNAFYGFDPPVDFTTGVPMTPDVWRTELAGFLEQVRQAFPGVEISHNSVWYSNTACCFPDFATPLNRDLDPNIQRQIAAADIINKEAGIGSDPGLQGGTGIWSLNSLFGYIDRIHAAGKHVTMAEYTLDRTGQEYALAGYFMISTGGDRYGDRSTFPTNWWSGFDVNLGSALGPRTYNNNGIYQRMFTGGMVLLNDPWGPVQNIPLNGTYSRVDGTVVTSVTLGPKQGAILLGTPPAVAASSTRWVSDMAWDFATNGYGAIQHDISTNGNPLTLSGKQYAKGLGAHADSEIHYPIGGACTRFTAVVGVDDEVPPGAGSADFQVWADGLLLFDSGHMTGGTPAQSIDVSLSGYAQLGLVVTDNGLGIGDSHSDWANAQVQCH